MWPYHVDVTADPFISASPSPGFGALIPHSVTLCFSVDFIHPQPQVLGRVGALIISIEVIQQCSHTSLRSGQVRMPGCNMLMLPLVEQPVCWESHVVWGTAQGEGAHLTKCMGMSMPIACWPRSIFSVWWKVGHVQPVTTHEGAQACLYSWGMGQIYEHGPHMAILKCALFNDSIVSECNVLKEVLTIILFKHVNNSK